MLKLPWLLAQVDPQKELEELKNAAKSSSPKLFGTDITVILAIVLGLAAILFFWAFFIRKRPKNARGSLVVERADKHSAEAYGASGRRKHRKRRPNHPANWGRNPTLSETGGLPPPRPEESETPPSASTSPQASPPAP
jgi:hypothetical protein